MKSRWVPPLLVLSVTLLISILVLEAAVRIIEPKKVLRESFERPDPVFHHRFIPNASGFYKSLEFNVSYSINSLGLRDREMSRKKPAGTKRVLMLGDSFTEGNGVEAKDAFPARVQALVDAAGLSTRWEVINAGEGGYSPLLEYLLLEHKLIDLEPDLVILNLDHSDVFDDIEFTKLATFDASGKPVAVHADPEREPGPWYVEAAYRLKDFLKEHTRLYNFLRRHVAPLLMARPDSSGDIRVDKYAMSRDGYDPGDGSDWSLTFGYIERVRDLLAARGVPLWLTVYPYGHQISSREWQKGRVFWGFEQNRVYSTTFQKQAEELARRRGIPVINMTDDFLERSKREFPLYFALDGHFLPAGHAVAAEAIFRQLLPFMRLAEGTRADTRGQ
jgi:lysophospholipase L1-like esterase